MTVSNPENGFRARLQRLARRTVVLAMVLGTCGLSAPSALAADDADAAADASAVETIVAAGVRGTVAPGEATSATLTVQNNTESELSGGRVEVELNRTPLTDAAAVTAWLDDGEAAGAFESVGTENSDAVQAGDSGSTSVAVPAEIIAALAPGVYPLRGELTGATTGNAGADDEVSHDETSTSVLVVTAAQPQTAVIVPLTATPADGSLLTLDELTALTAADGGLTAQLDAVTGTSAVLAVDPAIPAAIRALGTAAPPAVTDWLERLDDLPNERFALQFGDADAATQAHAGLPALLQPTTLAPFLDPQNFTAPVEATATPTATPAPTPTATAGPQLPDDATLTTVEDALPGVVWPRGDVAVADLATFSAYLGEESVTTIVPSTSITGASGGRAVQDGHDLLVTAAAASHALSRAASESGADARRHWLSVASAHLLLSSQAAASTPLLVGLERDETRTADALRDAIATADSAGFDLTALRAAPASAVSLAAEPDLTRATSLQRLLEEEATITQFASLLEDPQVLLSPERIRMLRVIGVGSTADEFAEAVTAEHASTQEILQSVQIPPSSTIQLLTANADLPFPVRNDLPWPVTIRLSVSPSDPRLDVEPVTEAVVQGNTSVRVKVPVSARVGSGELDLRLHLSSPTGVPIGGPQTVRVAVRAEWESIGLAVFGGLIVILIALGVIRTVRRKRAEANGTELDRVAVLNAADEKDLNASFPPSKDGRE